MDEFILDTVEHFCFLCSGSCLPVKREGNPGSLDSAIHSIQYLSRYLKMDMRKVFNEKGPIAPELLEKVEKAKLKVELCGECISLNETFSKLYRKLEKIDIEVKCCVNLIHKKFLKAKKKTANLNEGDVFNGRTQIVENLRNDAMEKCAATSCEGPPHLIVRIQNLTTEQVHKERQRINLIGSQIDKYAVEEANTACDFRTNYIENSFMEDEDDDDMETEAVEQPRSESADSDTHEGQNIARERVEKETLGIVPVAVVNPTEAVSSLPQSQPTERRYTRNTLTGKYKCNLCSKEFNSTTGCYYHYNSTHLKVKFKCNLCGKEFTQRHDFLRHHKSVHMGVRFKCLGCNKELKYKHDLVAHQRNTGCGRLGGAK